MTEPRLVHVSPHRREGESIPLVMWTVVLALLPALAVLMIWQIFRPRPVP